MAARGSIATARTISTSGSACGAPDHPDPHSNAKAFGNHDPSDPDGTKGNLADRFGWDSGEISDMVAAAVQEQDVEKRKQMYWDMQKLHTDSSPFVYMFQDSRKVAMRSSRQGRGARHHLLG